MPDAFHQIRAALARVEHSLKAGLLPFRLSDFGDIAETSAASRQVLSPNDKGTPGLYIAGGHDNIGAAE